MADEIKSYKHILEEEYLLSKELEKNIKHLEVKSFYEYLNKKRFFGNDLKKDLSRLYKILQESQEQAKNIYQKDEQEINTRKEWTEMFKKLGEIGKFTEDIVQNLENSKDILKQKYSDLLRIKDTTIAKLLSKEHKRKSFRLDLIKDDKNIKAAILHIATDFMTILNHLAQLMIRASNEYDKMIKEFRGLVQPEIQKVRDALENDTTAPIDAHKMITRIIEAEKNVIDEANTIIKDKDKFSASIKVAYSDAAQLEEIYLKMLRSMLQ